MAASSMPCKSCYEGGKEGAVLSRSAEAGTDSRMEYRHIALKSCIGAYTWLSLQVKASRSESSDEILTAALVKGCPMPAHHPEHLEC